MPTHTQKRPLKVHLLDISPHNQAILEFFFAGAGKQTFQVVGTQQDAEVFITDFDYPGAQKIWEESYASLDKATIAIAMQEPVQAECQWIPKPITSINLIAASEKIKETQISSPSPSQSLAPKQNDANYKRPPLTRHRNNKKTGKATVESSFSARPKSILAQPKGRTKTPPPLPETNNTLIAKDPVSSNIDTPTAPTKKATKPSLSKKRLEALTGQTSSTPTGRYNRENYFEGSIIAALRLARQTHKVIEIKYEPWQFYILYNEYTIVSQLDPTTSEEYQALCTTKIMPGQISLHILNDDESNTVKAQLTTHKTTAYNLEAFVWSTCLLSSQGKLTHRYDAKKVYLLTSWPNFTRLEQFPFAMNIAALWNYEPSTLPDIARKMDISENYINAFFNGANGLSLFEENPEKITNKATTKPRKKAGIIARLFSRLTRGGVNAI